MNAFLEPLEIYNELKRAYENHRCLQPAQKSFDYQSCKTEGSKRWMQEQNKGGLINLFESEMLHSYLNVIGFTFKILNNKLK